MSLPHISNLIAHYKMNEVINWELGSVGDPGIIASRALNSGYSDNYFSTLQPFTNHIFPGKIGNCIWFDGTNDYITFINSTTSFNLPTFSFCAWLKHSTNPVVWDRIISKKLFYSDSVGYEITLSGDDSDVLYTSGSSNVFATTPLGIDWLLSEWHHLVVIYNGANVTVYCDGSLKTTTGTVTPIIDSTYYLNIGKITSEDTTMWDGWMDDLRFYNIPITQDNVNSIYNSGRGTELQSDPKRPFMSFLPQEFSD